MTRRSFLASLAALPAAVSAAVAATRAVPVERAPVASGFSNSSSGVLTEASLQDAVNELVDRGVYHCRCAGVAQWATWEEGDLLFACSRCGGKYVPADSSAVRISEDRIAGIWLGGEIQTGAICLPVYHSAPLQGIQ